MCDFVDEFNGRIGIFQLEEKVGSLGTSRILWQQIIVFLGTSPSGNVGWQKQKGDHSTFISKDHHFIDQTSIFTQKTWQTAIHRKL
jgi:hypothetical protein